MKTEKRNQNLAKSAKTKIPMPPHNMISLQSWVNECMYFIYCTYNVSWQFTLLLGKIKRQLVKAPLAATISPYLISLTVYCWEHIMTSFDSYFEKHKAIQYCIAIILWPQQHSITRKKSISDSLTFSCILSTSRVWFQFSCCLCNAIANCFIF